MLFSVKLKPLVLVCALGLVLTGCGEQSSSTQGPDFGPNLPDPGKGNTTFDEKALLKNLVDNVITPTFVEFSVQTSGAVEKITTYCALEQQLTDFQTSQNQRDTAYIDATNAWKSMAVVWQQAELMKLGPLLENEGQLRNVIYAWPSKSICGIDQDVAYFEDGVINLDANKPYNIKDRTANRRGLVSLEHLLFSDNLAHSCSLANDAIADWNVRPEQERKVARCQFAVEVAKDLDDNAKQLVTVWTAENGYANALKTAGEEGSIFTSPHAAVNAISDALFYLTEEVKDQKLATPLGLFTNSCGLDICPQDVESVIANHSLENIKANLAAFEKLFLGQGNENGLGFDDFLDEENGSDIKQLMLDGLAEANLAADAIEGDLQTALQQETDKVTDTHTKVKAVTDQLKHDFINKLALELPKSSAGDND